MRTVRFLTVFFLVAPLSASALSVPFVGSPFAHMTPPLIYEVSLFAPNDSQTAATAAPTSDKNNPGKNDVCYDETTFEDNGQPVSNWTKGKNFDACEKVKGTCTNPQKKKLAGTANFADSSGEHHINRCDKNTSTKGTPRSLGSCVALGDSLTVGEFNKGCNASGTLDKGCDAGVNGDPANMTDPSHFACGSRTPSAISQTLDKMTPEQIDKLKSADTVVLSCGCSNDPSSSCPQKCGDLVQKLNGLGVDQKNVFCMGVGSKFDNLNQPIGDSCTQNGANFLGSLAQNDGVHASPDGYQAMLDRIKEGNYTVGQFAAADSPPGTTNTLSAAAFTDQGANDQIKSLACSVKGVQDCTQFGNNMTSTFGTECGGIPNCARVGSQVQGSFQQIPENYTQGIQSYLNACDQSTDACQTVQNTCTNGAADRMVHICSAASAVGKHLAVEDMIQSAYSGDPTKQAAAHMLYQIAPGQFDGGRVGDIQSFQLSDAARQALCSNNVCLAPGATGNDAVNALANTKGVQLGQNYVQTGGGGVLATGGNLLNTTNSNSPYSNSNPQIIYVSGNGSNPSISSGNTGFGGFGGLPLGTMVGSGLGNSLFNNTPNNPYNNYRPAPPPPPPTFTFVVQPQTVKRGDPVSLQWTTSGMSSTAPCTVTQNGTNIGSGNVGSISFTTSTSTATSTPSASNAVVFRLVCQAATNGQVYQQASTVLLQ